MIVMDFDGAGLHAHMKSLPICMHACTEPYTCMPRCEFGGRRTYRREIPHLRCRKDIRLGLDCARPQQAVPVRLPCREHQATHEPRLSRQRCLAPRLRAIMEVWNELTK